MASRAALHVIQLPRGPLPGIHHISQNVTHKAVWPCPPPFNVSHHFCALLLIQAVAGSACSVPPSAPGNLWCVRGDPGPPAEWGGIANPLYHTDRTLALLRWDSQSSSTCPTMRRNSLASVWGSLAATPLPTRSNRATGRGHRLKLLSQSLSCVHPLPKAGIQGSPDSNEESS